MKDAIDKLYSNRSDFIIVGLTGRTGSGCTTTAQLLARGRADFPEASITAPTYEPEERKQNIVLNYFRHTWQPFRIITASHVLLSYFDCEDATTIKAYLTKNQSNYPTIDIREVAESLRAIAAVSAEKWTIVKRAGGHANASSNQLSAVDSGLSELAALAKTLRQQLGGSYTPLLQKVGDNIRRCGRPFDDDSNNIDHLFTIAERLNRVVKCLRRHAKAEREKAYFAIDAFRNPFEIDYFKERYSAFYIWSINTPNEHRISRLNAKLSGDAIHAIDLKEYPSENAPLSNYDALVSQNIQQCIQKADIHLNNPGKGPTTDPASLAQLARQIIRYTSLIKHPGLVTPTRHERCMQIAFNAKVNSGCISRQVGAVVTDSAYAIRAIGWNDVPLGQTSCLLRDYDEFLDTRPTPAFSQYERSSGEFRENVIAFFKDIDRSQLDGLRLVYCFRDRYNDVKRTTNQVHTRSLHAEENAFLQIAKSSSVLPPNGILYSTASPCELCSKKAYQLGIREIVYVDPYPGISKDHVLASGSSMPTLTLFSGAVGDAYTRIYSQMLPFKDELAARWDLRSVNEKEQARGS
jgi:deoxycytidylate deaminase/dephospho-CoA kinase